jgi:DNA-directed RNA polymerase subunit RPC12/RpoP
MELTYECPECGAINRVRDSESAPEFRCQSCGQVRAARANAVAAEGVCHCPYCGTDKLYIQKDFPQGLGLFIVVSGFALATWFWYLNRPLATYGVLLASALLDLVLWKIVPDVAICYRCISQMRGPDVKPLGRYGPFNLEIGETFRQERIRIAELRKKQSAQESQGA